MSKIFISYRREDSLDTVGRIYDNLVLTIPRNDIFLDVDSISIGQDFRAVVDKAIQQSKVFLLIIGPKWTGIQDAQGNKRLNNPDDLVRVEIELALKYGLAIIPVLIQNASVPQEIDLPPSIQRITSLNAALVRPNPDFHNDIERLKTNLKTLEGLHVAPVGKYNTPSNRNTTRNPAIAMKNYNLIRFFSLVFIFACVVASFLVTISTPTYSAYYIILNLTSTGPLTFFYIGFVIFGSILGGIFPLALWVACIRESRLLNKEDTAWLWNSTLLFVACVILGIFGLPSLPVLINSSYKYYQLRRSV